MREKGLNNWLKFFVIVLISGLGVAFVVKNDSDKLAKNASKALENAENVGKVKQKDSSKQNILDSLNSLKLDYDVALLEKTALSEQLELERKNVENLMEIVKASEEPSSSQIEVYRKQLLGLKSMLNAKVLEINQLKNHNKKLLTEIEGQNVRIDKNKRVYDTLVSKQKELESTLKTASKLTLSNFKVVALRDKRSGEELETNKGSKADKLKASFSINGNSIAKTGRKVFYVQVLDQDNFVLGENKLIEFDEKSALVYSFIVAVDFQHKPVSVYGILNSRGRKFQKGVYFVNFFDKDELVGTASIVLG